MNLLDHLSIVDGRVALVAAAGYALVWARVIARSPR